MSGAQTSRLSGGRLHLHHGPIDIVFQAFGDGAAAAETRAIGRFRGVLEELVGELPLLRSQAEGASGDVAKGKIVRAMARAVAPHAETFVTPMAAVAGAVADAVVGAAVGDGVQRVYANNGGDAAIWLASGEAITVAIGGSKDRATIRADDPIRGVATSGWRGRSHSLGIADAVTVLAGSAAAADVAATLIANAVDLPGSDKVARMAACEIYPDSDLGTRMVTRGVGALTTDETAAALAAGARVAEEMLARGLMHSAVLYLGEQSVVVGKIPILIKD